MTSVKAVAAGLMRRRNLTLCCAGQEKGSAVDRGTTSADNLFAAFTFVTFLAGALAVGKVIYLMNSSLDGFVEGPDGKFDWIVPDEEVHRFHGQQALGMGALLYGRRMYETMAVWQTMDSDLSLPDYMLEFARIWKTKPKVIFSKTIKAVGANCRLAQGSIVEEVAALKMELGGDFGVSGPGIAAEMARLRLIDEYRIVVYPIIVGGGKSYFPKLESPVRLELLESRNFMCGATYLRYQAL